MIIKRGRYILGEIHEVRKGLWGFFLDCFSDADWLGRQTPDTWSFVFSLWSLGTKRRFMSMPQTKRAEGSRCACVCVGYM